MPLSARTIQSTNKNTSFRPLNIVAAHTHLYISPNCISKFCSWANNWHLSVQTCNSCTSSGTTRNVRHPPIFLDFRMSPNMWSPTYNTSLPLAPINSVNTSHDPVIKDFFIRHNSINQRTQSWLFIPPHYFSSNNPIMQLEIASVTQANISEYFTL